MLVLTCSPQMLLVSSARKIDFRRPSRAGAMLACTAPTSDQAKTYREAAAAVKPLLEKFNPVKADTEAINTALKKVTFDESMVGKFESVADTLEAGVASKNGRLGPLKSVISDLTAKLSELNKAYAPYKLCEDDASIAPEVKTVIEDFKSINTSVQEQLKTPEKLQEAIKNIPDKVQEFIALIATKAQGAIPLAPQLAPQTLRLELAKALPDLARALRVRRQLEPVATRISKALDPAVVAEVKPFITQKPQFSFDRADSQLRPALAKLTDWSVQAAQVAREQQAQAQDALFKAMRDPLHFSSEALALSSVVEAQRRDFNALADAFLVLLTEMQREDVRTLVPPDFVPDKARELSTSTEVLQLMTARFARSVVQLSGEIPVDKSTWSMASVDLFYFDSVERLMRVLSPSVRKIGGNESLRGEANQKRLELLQKSQALEEAERAVGDARQAVANLQERVRLATVRSEAATRGQRAETSQRRREAETAEARARALTDRRKRADNIKAEAQRRFDRAQTVADTSPTDEKKQADLEIARGNLQRATRFADDAKTDEDTAGAEATVARDRVDDATEFDPDASALSTELTTARGKLDEAISARTTAAGQHNAALREAFIAAQVENFAFAEARDNAPFLTNQPEPRPAGSPAPSGPGPFLDTDPLSRVLLFAFPDSRTVFVRGAQDDIDLVRLIIKEFDRPQGQAMMTLRTIEINSDGSKDSGRRALRFLKQMDSDLIGAQTKIESALAQLRDVINAQVRKAIAEHDAELDRQIARSTAGSLERKMYEYQKRQLELNETLTFYDPEVLKALGWREDFLKQTIDTNFLNAVIPAPSQTVNLAQALIVLTLASKTNRKAIVDNLKAPHFASLRRFLGAEGMGAEVLGFQAKLVDALRFNGIAHVLELAEAKVRLRVQLDQEMIAANTDLGEAADRLTDLESKSTTLDAALGRIEDRLRDPRISQRERSDLDNRREQIKLRKRQLVGEIEVARQVRDDARKVVSDIETTLFVINRDLGAIVSWLQGNTTLVPPELLIKQIKQAIDADSTATLLQRAVGLRRSARFRFSQANESAVNLTFRRYIEQVNRDLTETFVKPTFRNLNEKLLKERLGVGIIQETSILASNRLVARVDPRGSAQLAVGEEKNVLEAAIQLTNLFGLAGKGLVSGATGNPLALAGSGGGSSILSTAQSVLGALDQLPRGAAPAVYGISTGNLFQVTPVIDPSGQALRFRFDFVAATQIREPNDTIDPMLPRIERHSVNTEVQLGDQEIRLVSQFQANSRLGIASRKSGGFPILKDIPGVSEVPLIGWFVKRGGRAAQTQESFIFCQTNMYPTLSEVIDSSVRSPTFTGLGTP